MLQTSTYSMNARSGASPTFSAILMFSAQACRADHTVTTRLLLSGATAGADW